MQIIFIIWSAFFIISNIIIFSFPIHLTYWIFRYVKWNPLLLKTKPSKAPVVTHLFLALFLFILFIPNYFKWSAKAKQSEAKFSLGQIYVAQQAYFSRTNTYASGPDAFKLINWEPAGQNRYAYYCQGAVILNRLPIGVDFTHGREWRWPVETFPASSRTGFTCMAVGNIDNDETLDVWSINDAKILLNDQSDV